MSHMMNGHPIWCRPAPTKGYDFPDEPKETKDFSEMPALIEAARKKGLVQFPENEGGPGILGSKSEWASCAGCGMIFGRRKNAGIKECETCRLEKVDCKNCGKKFKPLHRQRFTCSEACRGELVRVAAQQKRGRRKTVMCENCGKEMQLIPSSTRKNCSKACSSKSMKLKYKTNESKTQ